MDSHQVVRALHEVDPRFVTFAKTLFGETVQPDDVWTYLYAPDGVSKMSPGLTDLHTLGSSAARTGRLVPKTTRSAMPGKAPLGAPKPVGGLKPSPVVARKAYDAEIDTGLELVWKGTFSKTVDEKRQAFGWASIVEVDGQPFVDMQNDYIHPDDLEAAAYTYVRKSRVGGTQHKRDETGAPLRAGDLIETAVFTDEKYEAFAKSFGADPSIFDSAPRGWWVGFQYDDHATWEDIKAGRKTGFSIHGKGKRVPVEV